MNMVTRLHVNELGAATTERLRSTTLRRYRDVFLAGERAKMRDLFEVRTPPMIDGPAMLNDFRHLMLRAAASTCTWNVEYWQVTRAFEVHLRDQEFRSAYTNYLNKVRKLLVTLGRPKQVNAGCFTPVSHVLASELATPGWAFYQSKATVSA